MLDFFRIQEVKEDTASLLEDKANTLNAVYVATKHLASIFFYILYFHSYSQANGTCEN